MSKHKNGRIANRETQERLSMRDREISLHSSQQLIKEYQCHKMIDPSQELTEDQDQLEEHKINLNQKVSAKNP